MRSLLLIEDFTFTYNCPHGRVNFPAAYMGLCLNSTIMRANGLELKQICPSHNTFASLFRCRAVSQWNKLPVNIVSAKSFNVFKRLVHNYLFNLQYSDSIISDFLSACVSYFI